VPAVRQEGRDATWLGRKLMREGLVARKRDSAALFARRWAANSRSAQLQQ